MFDLVESPNGELNRTRTGPRATGAASWVHTVRNRDSAARRRQIQQPFVQKHKRRERPCGRGHGAPYSMSAAPRRMFQQGHGCGAPLTTKQVSGCGRDRRRDHPRHVRLAQRSADLGVQCPRGRGPRDRRRHRHHRYQGGGGGGQACRADGIRVGSHTLARISIVPPSRRDKFPRQNRCPQRQDMLRESWPRIA